MICRRDIVLKSITDRPIEKLEEDLLRVERYSKALTNFIKSSDTPITIGLQGEWGTGKTSLMGLMREKLDKEDIATSWVNTWEYSMFVGSHETTPKVLQGMLEKLEENCVKNGSWDIGEKGSQAIKTVGKFLGSIANQMVKKQTGVNVLEAYDTNNTYQLQSEVALIKEEINKVITQLIQSSGNPYKKVVFFVDDLDRINPKDAVEVLEALKNIFDLPNCIYVLAIDYDVVVKGLEYKFGKKTVQNEREFRSFFDKIIQVPFSMPTGTYNISDFLEAKLKEMGITLDESDLKNFDRVVRRTVGTNPRSLKRYLNSFSLINNVRAIEDENDEQNDFMLFALLGLQISYPQIFRLIARDPDFASWSKSNAGKLNVDLSETEKKLAVFGDNKLLDDEWQKIIWAVCQSDTFLKSRVFQILKLLNLIKEISGDSLQTDVEAALEFASITNVDDDPDSKQISQSSVRAALEGGLEEWSSGKKYDETKRLYVEKFINLLKLSKCDLEEKYARTQISFRNSQKLSGQSNILYINSVGKNEIKFGVAGQRDKKTEIQKLVDLLPLKYKANLKERLANNRKQKLYFLTFEVPFQDLDSGDVSGVVDMIEQYKKDFH